VNRLTQKEERNYRKRLAAFSRLQIRYQLEDNYLGDGEHWSRDEYNEEEKKVGDQAFKADHWYVSGLRFIPDVRCPLTDDGHLVPYLVQWRKGTDKKEEWHTLAQLKELFPKQGNFRIDLKEYCKQARAYYEAGDERRVYIDGCRDNVQIIDVPVEVPPAVDPPPVDATAAETPQAAGVMFREPYFQAKGRLCAYSAIRNLGYYVPDDMKSHDLSALMHYLCSNGIVHFQRVKGAAPFCGKFVYTVANHVFCRINGLFLDTDDSNPRPVKSMQELGYSSYDACFSATKMRKR